VITVEQQQQSAEGRFGPKQPPPPDPYDTPKSDKGAAAETLAAAAAEKARDYPAELLSAVHGAESCVQPRTASAAVPTEVLISLEALVLESGTIVSGTARGAALTPEEIECVKRRLESTRLPDKVKDAPRRVSATLKLTFKPQEPAPAAPGANPAPQPTAAPTPTAY